LRLNEANAKADWRLARSMDVRAIGPGSSAGKGWRVRVEDADGSADLVTWGGDYSLIERVPFSTIYLLLDAGSVIWPAG
jgi:hypothetical protein